MIDSGAGLVVGTVSDDGEPRADRGWAVVVVDEHGRRVRFVMSADDPAVVRNLETGSVSLTGAEVVTYQSIQLKGRPVVVEPPTAGDIEMARGPDGDVLRRGPSHRRQPASRRSGACCRCRWSPSR